MRVGQTMRGVPRGSGAWVCSSGRVMACGRGHGATPAPVFTLCGGEVRGDIAPLLGELCGCDETAIMEAHFGREGYEARAVLRCSP